MPSIQYRRTRSATSARAGVNFSTPERFDTFCY